MLLAGSWRAGITVWMLGVWAATGWTLSQHPFAQPVLARGAEEAKRAIDAAVARHASADWLEAELRAALEAADAQDAALLLDIAAARDLPLPDDLQMAAKAMTGADDGFLARGRECAACAWDIAACRTIREVAVCALPAELSPLGDVNALRRNGVAWWQDEAVDELEVGLAVVGLAATGAILVTGGSAATIKAGATLARTARRTGALSPRLAADLTEAARGAVLWDRLPAVLNGARAGTALDPVHAARLARAAQDLGRIVAATSPARTLAILRFADTPDDLARLARLSETAGDRTQAALRVLGPARAYRLLDRLSGPFLAALALIGLVAAQLGGLLGGFALRRLAPRQAGRETALASAGGHRP